MSKTTIIVGAALAGLIPAAASAAQSDSPVTEKCATGTVRAGMNDCATSSNACHGHVAVDNNPEAWIYVPVGTCAKLTGAKISKAVDPTPSKSSLRRPATRPPWRNSPLARSGRI